MICSQCNKEFTPLSNRKKYCSKECSKKGKKEYKKKYNQSDKAKAYKKAYQKSENNKVAQEKYRKNNWEKIKQKNNICHNNRVKKDPDYPHKVYLIYKKNNPETLRKAGKRNRDQTRSSPRRLELRRNTIKLYMKERRKSDPIFKLASNVRGRLGAFLKMKNIRKTNKTFAMVGCTPEFLKEHLEKQFKIGMTWKNYGKYGWHIDHKDPLDLAMTPEDVLELSHYTNLQPMWATENLKKGNKVNYEN